MRPGAYALVGPGLEQDRLPEPDERDLLEIGFERVALGRGARTLDPPAQGVSGGVRGVLAGEPGQVPSERLPSARVQREKAVKPLGELLAELLGQGDDRRDERGNVGRNA